MGKLYRISGSTKPAKKGKAITFGYEPFSTESVDEFKEYINTHATIPVNVKGGHRSSENITEIYDWIRLDVDEKGMYKNVEKQLSKAGVSYIKKPSTSNVNKGMDWKWHYFIETEGISQNYDIYKQQYYKFLSEVGIDTSWIDMSLLSVVQNMSICGEDGIKKTEVVKGKVWVAPQGLTALKPPKHNKKSSDNPKFEIKKALSKIDPNCSYEDWVKVGMALYDWCPKRGFKLYDKWSQGGESYDGTTKDKWNDFARNLKGGVTVGTLMHLAYGEKDTFENEKPLSKEEKKAVDILSIIEKMAMSDADYEKIENQKYIVDKILPKGALGYFIGREKSGKSWVTYKLSIDALKHSKKNKVLYFDIDAGAIFSKKRVKIIRKKFGNRFKYISQAKQQVTPRSVQDAIEKLGGIDLSDYVIFIDSLSKIAEGKINKPEDVAPLVTKFEELRNAGATVVVIHHLNKRGDGAGSYIFNGSQDFKYMVKAIKGHDSDGVERLNTIVLEAVDCRTDNRSFALEITDFHKVKAKEVDYISAKTRVENDEDRVGEEEDNRKKKIKYLKTHEDDVDNIKEVMKYLKENDFDIKHTTILSKLKDNVDYPNVSSDTLTRILNAGLGIHWELNIKKSLKHKEKQRGSTGGRPPVFYKLI